MSDAITQATKQVTELAKFRTFLAGRAIERFVFELDEALKEAEISPKDRRDIFARLASEARQLITISDAAEPIVCPGPVEHDYY
jgi:hypothetical protein